MKDTARRYMEYLWLKRKRTGAERTALTWARAMHPRWAKDAARRLDPLTKRLRVQIVACPDMDADMYRRLQYGDTWVRYELIKAFGRMSDIVVTDRCPDVVIHLYGRRQPLPPAPCKMLWIYSHPDSVGPDLLRLYDRIFCLSDAFTTHVRSMGFEAETLWGATQKEPRREALRHDVVFVGNARPDTGRRAVVDALATVDARVRIWGKGYVDVPAERWGGPYVDYTQLDRIYASSKIALCDHWPDMKRWGFVAVRVFDILACGGFCISDDNKGVNEIFGNAVPQYHSPDELRDLIVYYLSRDKERQLLSREGRRIALHHGWKKRAETFKQAFK